MGRRGQQETGEGIRQGQGRIIIIKAHYMHIYNIVTKPNYFLQLTHANNFLFKEKVHNLIICNGLLQ